MNELRLDIDRRDLERVIDTLDVAPKVIQEAKRAAFTASTPKLYEALLAAFRDVGLHDPPIDKNGRQKGSKGKVLSWQEQYVGSGGGYAAVRPRAETFTATNGRGKQYAVGYVTNSINAGHRYPNATMSLLGAGKTRYQVSRMAKGMGVPPYTFYDMAQAKIPAIARETAEKVAQALISHLEGD